MDVTVTKPFLVDIECMIWPPQMGPAGEEGSVHAGPGQEEAERTNEGADRESEVEECKDLRRFCARRCCGGDVQVVRCRSDDA